MSGWRPRGRVLACISTGRGRSEGVAMRRLYAVRFGDAGFMGKIEIIGINRV